MVEGMKEINTIRVKIYLDTFDKDVVFTNWDSAKDFLINTFLRTHKAINRNTIAPHLPKDKEIENVITLINGSIENDMMKWCKTYILSFFNIFFSSEIEIIEEVIYTNELTPTEKE